MPGRKEHLSPGGRLLPEGKGHLLFLVQILAPLMGQIASRYPSQDSHKAPGIFSDVTGILKGKQAAQPDTDSPGEKAEVWEAGAVAYELLVGQPPTAVPAAPPTSGGLIRQTSFLGFLGFLSDDCVDFLQAVRAHPISPNGQCPDV